MIYIFLEQVVWTPPDIVSNEELVEVISIAMLICTMPSMPMISESGTISSLRALFLK